MSNLPLDITDPFILACVVAVLQLADWYTTARVLSKGGVELNPIMKFLIDKLGVRLALPLKGLLVSFLALYTTDIITHVVIIVVYLLVVLNNFLVLRKMP